MVLAIDRVRKHVESDLDDAALQILIDTAYAMINKRLGDAAATAPDSAKDLAATQLTGWWNDRNRPAIASESDDTYRVRITIQPGAWLHSGAGSTLQPWTARGIGVVE